MIFSNIYLKLEQNIVNFQPLKLSLCSVVFTQQPHLLSIKYILVQEHDADPKSIQIGLLVPLTMQQSGHYGIYTCLLACSTALAYLGNNKNKNNNKYLRRTN